MTTKLEFLAQHPLFNTLDEEELEELAEITGEYEYQDGAIVAYQRDIADSLIILKDGRLYAERVDRGRVSNSQSYDKPNEYIGLEWLFAPSTYPATMRAAAGHGRPTRLIIIESKSFLHFLSQNQDAIDYLEPEYDNTNNLIAGFPEEIYQEALKIKAKRDRRSNTMNILPDELIEFNSRRSGYFLMVRLLPPLIGLLLVPSFVTLFLTSSLQPDSFFYNLQFLCPGVLALFFVGWGIFRFLDWTNDYFIVTNRRIIHREFSLRTFRIDIKIARIDQIQSVSVDKPTLLANLLKYGTVRITTASQFGVILFDNINHPTRVTNILGTLTRQVKVLDASREQTLVRQSIEEYFQFEKPYEMVGEGGGDDEYEEEEYEESLWSRFYGRYQWRVEEGTTITYRKHFLVAMRALLWPMIIGTIIFVFTYFTVRFEVITGAILFPILILLYMIVFFWTIWQIENWRNDLFQLTDSLIIDIDRLPFGFGESSKRAALENIQNVKAYTPGLIHTIFNYGYVEVETAGVDSNIMFEDVPYPAVVQSDIFHQIEEFKRKQREGEEARRHKAFAVLLDVYKQEEEQGRLPRRTPPDLDWEELEEYDPDFDAP